MTPCEYPPPVEAGDRVAVLSPSHAAPAAFDRGLDRLRSFDVDPVVYPTARRETEWLRDHPEERAADLERAFADPSIRGVVATMGGNVAVQVRSRLDLDVLERNPTRFLGGSDNTHLHSLLTRCGQVSHYGGQLFPDLVADDEMHPYTRRHVRRALRSTSHGQVDPADEWTDEYADFEEGTVRSWYPGDGWTWHLPGADETPVRGPLVGGCLSMLRMQLALGAPGPLADPEGCVLVVETSGETPPPAAVERFFTVLGERGALGSLAALLVGRPETPSRDPAERERYRTAQRRAVTRTVDTYAPDLPVVFDLDVGHTAPVLPLPLGATTEVDPGERTIRFP
ncbi:S66 family peptidase [Halomarina litorea]|uniref:S66 family peptidase n=1 Tax=Halomarina litorea TaxID=2961595 RepID=UPI0020C1CEE6|nr:S66 peptidase family protein [Halomarina sp. BCD28]